MFLSEPENQQQSSLQSKMKSRTQKLNSTVFAFAVRTFLMGVEYAVIFPSLWLYLQTFHADYWYLGLVLSAYNAIAAASAILIGRLTDRNAVNFLVLGLVLNLAEVNSLHRHFLCKQNNKNHPTYSRLQVTFQSAVHKFVLKIPNYSTKI